MVFARYADDLVIGFEQREDAERFLKEFRKRLATFALELHPEKTRLIEFGRFEQVNRQQRGEGKPEPFTFLGFTHYCATNSTGIPLYAVGLCPSGCGRRFMPSRRSCVSGCMSRSTRWAHG